MRCICMQCPNENLSVGVEVLPASLSDDTMKPIKLSNATERVAWPGFMISFHITVISTEHSSALVPLTA